VSATCYIDLLQNGPSILSRAIENDTDRATVNEDDDIDSSALIQLQRILNAFVWLHAGKCNRTWLYELL
jgi:hypothetical protein